ncbi:hypothetical protein HOU95_gp103 [Streptomyces phage Hiyaa]|uniref:Uncharacterized protein n=1 Tax=Streptomyces phage Hiyaa TaxID=2499072 RepID=A0A3S9U8Q5_9CAUD|nr:hypothetical protein HOU95_gp103 [Streptomyces phage Hiyaa]AZS06704.1 hypothetical protein SEA_HIYAA_65 [Streptomyces phage Hiyaa]
MRVTITSDVLEHEHDGQPVNSNFATAYIAGAEPYIVPGVTSWDNVQAEMPDPNTVVITADLTTLDTVPKDDASTHGDTPVTTDWVRDYVTGADAYWLAPGVLRATEVTFAD